MADRRADIQAAFDRMPTTFGSKRAAKNLEPRLMPGEVVEEMVSGSYASGTGVVVLTNQRLLVVRDDFTKQKVEDFPLSQIASVTWSSGTLGGLTVASAANKVIVRSMDNKAGEALAARLRTLTTTAPTAAVDPTGLLAQLADLHAAGVLTDEEFAAKKAEVLARM